MNKLKYVIIISLFILITLFLFVSYPVLCDFYDSLISDGLTQSLNTYIDKKVLSVSILSLTGLLIAILNYLRKSGIEIQADMCLRSTIQEEQIILSLFNNKDKPILITEVYLKLSKNIYISAGIDNESAEQGNKHQILLKPYELQTIKTEISSKFVVGNYEVIDIFHEIKSDSKIKIIVLTPQGEIACKQLKNLIPRAIRSLNDNSIIIVNGIFPQNFKKISIDQINTTRKKRSRISYLYKKCRKICRKVFKQ